MQNRRVSRGMVAVAIAVGDRWQVTDFLLLLLCCGCYYWWQVTYAIYKIYIYTNFVIFVILYCHYYLLRSLYSVSLICRILLCCYDFSFQWTLLYVSTHWINVVTLQKGSNCCAANQYVLKCKCKKKTDMVTIVIL